ncbi:MAG: hypothetical protein ACRDSR_07245 [Pseudonocardiaceae bacterium]
MAEFGRCLRGLRQWAHKITQKALEGKHPALTDATISDHERGTRLPRLEWLHAYVVACLRHRYPDFTREELTAEFEHWRAAWTRLEHAPAPRTLTMPTPRDATPATPPEPATAVPGPEPAPAAITVDKPARSRRVQLPRRRAVLISGGVVVLVVGVAAYATTGGLFEHDPNPGPAHFAGNTATAVPVHASGTVDNLGTKQGIDLDTGQRLDQNAPGVDISFSSASTHMDAMANRVSYHVLPQPVTTPEKRMCETVDGWAREYKDVHALTEGRAVCVKTDEGRLSMMIITQRATNATGTISLRFITWP